MRVYGGIWGYMSVYKCILVYMGVYECIAPYFLAGLEEKVLSSYLHWIARHHLKVDY